MSERNKNPCVTAVSSLITRLALIKYAIKKGGLQTGGKWKPSLAQRKQCKEQMLTIFREKPGVIQGGIWICLNSLALLEGLLDRGPWQWLERSGHFGLSVSSVRLVILGPLLFLSAIQLILWLCTLAKRYETVNSTETQKVLQKKQN